MQSQDAQGNERWVKYQRLEAIEQGNGSLKYAGTLRAMVDNRKLFRDAAMTTPEKAIEKPVVLYVASDSESKKVAGDLANYKGYVVYPVTSNDDAIQWFQDNPNIKVKVVVSAPDHKDDLTKRMGEIPELKDIPVIESNSNPIVLGYFVRRALLGYRGEAMTKNERLKGLINEDSKVMEWSYQQGNETILVKAPIFKIRIIIKEMLTTWGNSRGFKNSRKILFPIHRFSSDAATADGIVGLLRDLYDLKGLQSFSENQLLYLSVYSNVETRVRTVTQALEALLSDLHV